MCLGVCVCVYTVLFMYVFFEYIIKPVILILQ